MLCPLICIKAHAWKLWMKVNICCCVTQKFVLSRWKSFFFIQFIPFYTVLLQVLYLQIIIDTPLNYTLLQLLFLQFQCNINKFIWQGGHEKHHFGRYVPHATRNSASLMFSFLPIINETWYLKSQCSVNFYKDASSFRLFHL